MRSGGRMRVGIGFVYFVVALILSFESVAQAKFALHRTQAWSRHPAKKDPAAVGTSNNTWYYNASGAPSNANESDVKQQLVAAMTQWNGVLSKWTFYTSSISNTTDPPDPLDTFHDVGWYHESGAALAVTTYPWPSGYQPDGADIKFNTYYTWAFSSTTPSTAYDFRSVALHELGHVVGSGHSSTAQNVMYYAIPQGSQKRSLQTDDTYVASYLYGSSLDASVQSGAPALMTVGVDYYVTFQYVVSAGFSPVPSSECYLDISLTAGNAAVAVYDYSPEWDAVDDRAIGSTIYRYSGTTMLATNRLFSARRGLSLPSNASYFVTLRVRALDATSPVAFLYRANYVNSSHQEPTSDNGAVQPSAPAIFGDLSPRTSSYLDQQGFPAARLSIPVVAGPAAPSGLSASAASSAQINLVWMDNATNETGYKVERKTGTAGTWGQIGTAGASATSYPDTTCSPSTTYYYRVRATNGAGDSGHSNEASATTPAPPVTIPAAPSGLSASAASSTQINLVWVDNATNETGYKVERKTGTAGTWGQIGTAGASATSYPDTTCSSSTTYYYRVRATNSAGDSSFSNEVSGTTPAPLTCTTLSCASPMVGSLSTTDATNGHNGPGVYVDRYCFAGEAGRTITFDLVSASFDAYLYLLDPSGNVVAWNDDWSGLNSHISFTLPSSGQWTVEATSYHQGATGPYTLTMSGCANGNGTAFYPLAPCRIIDSRNAAGPAGGPGLSPQGSRMIYVAGASCGVPATATAVAVNLTAISPPAHGALKLIPSGTSPTAATALSFRAGRMSSNNVIAKLGPDGAAVVFADTSSGTTQFTLDVSGYFAPSWQEVTVWLPGAVPLILTRVPAGTFQMGSPTTERSRETDGTTEALHQVSISSDYYIGKYEITHAQWVAVMASHPDDNPSCGASCPQNLVSWNQVSGTDGFLQRLNAHLSATGQQGAGMFRLPTEAEWERACRGGTQSRFSFGDALNGYEVCNPSAEADPYMWFCGSSGGSQHPVGTRRPNPYGLFDMHGNVYEWCADWYSDYSGVPETNPVGPPSGTYRVVRGGSASDVLARARSAARLFMEPNEFSHRIGFRVARTR